MKEERDSRNPERKRIWTVSNVITITRILLVPVFVAALLAPWPEWFGMNEAFSNDWKSVVAAGIFVLISCTDWLDGYLARSRGEVTDFGKFMDPLADKILVAAALIALVELGSLPTWVVLVILAREFIVSGVRMMAATEGVVIAASMLGKFKTVFQMIAIVLFVVKDSHMIGGFGEALSDQLWVVSWAFMLVAVGLTIASLIDYLVKARELLGFGGGAGAPGCAMTAPADPSRPQASGSEAGLRPDEPLMQAGDAALGASGALLARAAGDVVRLAIERKASLATAESLTGGMIGAALTSAPGSSAAYRGGVVSYVNDVKRDVLGVAAEVLEDEGAVCERTARQMAEGALQVLDADAAVAVTGIAGPGGAEPGKPVGTVWIAVSTRGADGTLEAGVSAAKRFEFAGSREEVRAQTACEALGMLRSALE